MRITESTLRRIIREEVQNQKSQELLKKWQARYAKLSDAEKQIVDDFLKAKMKKGGAMSEAEKEEKDTSPSIGFSLGGAALGGLGGLLVGGPIGGLLGAFVGLSGGAAADLYAHRNPGEMDKDIFTGEKGGKID